MSKEIKYIEVRGASVHNLKQIDVDIPFHKITGIAGVSGSGKSSLALGVLYAEGSRRYLEALSTYTRRRMTQARKANVESIKYVPAALALHQRPAVPGIRSTFGTSTELLNSLRLMFSRLASHRCPNGHYLKPSMNVAAEKELVCPVCGARFYGPSAESLAFNSQGACPTCSGTGIGAVLPWQTLMWSLMKDIARDLGVRTDVPFKDLTDHEKEIVFHGPPVKQHMVYQNGKTGAAGEMDFTYFNATYTVENALSKVKDEKGFKRVEKFLKQDICPDCHGTRLSKEARTPKIMDLSLDQVCQMSLVEVIEWVKKVPNWVPNEMKPMAESICASFLNNAKRLMDLGLGYLTLDRAGSTLSTGERQRMQLARSIRNETTGVLYVLDEPSIGLHPANIEGLVGVMDDLVDDGNTVVLVDHDTQVLKHADYLIEMGPQAGKNGGHVIATGSVDDLISNKESIIGPFLGNCQVLVNQSVPEEHLFDEGTIIMHTDAIHTVKPLEVKIPKGRLSVVTGVSGSGKTTMVLESLVPALEASINEDALPKHVKDIDAPGIEHVKLIDATPIGINNRSTVATYAKVHDELRKAFAKTEQSIHQKLKAGAFSYNTGKLRCPTCDGTGSVSLDVQFLPDVEIDCPDCRGSRYGQEAYAIKWTNQNGESYSLPELMEMSVDEALKACVGLKSVERRLNTLSEMGLGYLTLGEETPGLSGGEAQRLKLASEMGKTQKNALFVFDEPTIGLHPLDVETLLKVFMSLIDQGATIVVIEHDQDVIKNADYIIDMGPQGGEYGGEIVCSGTVEKIKQCPQSLTGKYLK